MAEQTNEIKPIAIPGIHDKFYNYLKSHFVAFDNPLIIDLGAGHGYLVKKLHEKNYNVHAADLFPEYYYYDKVPCLKTDITKNLPFESNSYDIIIAVEVMEHISDHELFFNEAYRILKKGGLLFFTTPNILSLKSRFQFLLSGFFYSFSPIDNSKNDGLQHVSSLTFDQYKYIALKANFESIDYSFDKRQNTSLYLLLFKPLIWLYCKLKAIDLKPHNSFDFLTGRILFVKLRK